MADPTPAKIGRRRQRIGITRPGAPVADTFGNWTTPVVAVGTYWAEVHPISGREAIVIQQLRPETTHSIEVKWSASLAGADESWAATYRGQTLEFTRVHDPDGHRRILLIEAKAVKPTPTA